MLLQLILAVIGTAFTFSSPVPVLLGTLANEEECLEFLQTLKKTEEEQIKKDCDSTLKGTELNIESRYRIANRTSRTINYYWNVVSKSLEYGHLIREKIISTESKKEELEELIEKIRIVYQVLEKSLEHEKEERKFENTQPQVLSKDNDYEIIDKEILELENEKEEWQNLLDKLESRLNYL